jgi:diacylglycerol kinase family enzyme
MSYLYLYDSFLGSPKYQKIIDKIENRLTDLGINGRTVKLSIIKNATEIIKDALKKDVQTVVAIGRDTLLCEAAAALVNQPTVLGFIPIGPSIFGEILGIPTEEIACEVIASRRIEFLDIGKINQHYFFSSVSIQGGEVDIRCEETYKINLISVKNLKVSNLDFIVDPNGEKRVSNPLDGLLEATFSVRSRSFLPLLKKKEYQDSIFYIKKININSTKGKEIPIIVDQERIFKTPVEIEVVPQSIKIIVGRERLI